FFSSRRRHTRWPRDWSSDVCSSDLWLQMPAPVEEEMEVRALIQQIAIEHRRRYGIPANRCGTAPPRYGGEPQAGSADYAGGSDRSEERRVGKEWGGGWAA